MIDYSYKYKQQNLTNPNNILELSDLINYSKEQISFQGLFDNCQYITEPLNKTNNNIINVTSMYSNCKSLTHTGKLPSGIKTLDYTFYRCYWLNTVDYLPDSVEEMNHTFERCRFITKIINFPLNLKRMSYTFFSCTELSKVNITSPELESLEYAFYDCYNLKEIIIVSKKVNNIHQMISPHSNELIEIIVPDNSLTLKTIKNHYENNDSVIIKTY